jgi:superfamily II DNA or RNA helicase
MSTKFFTNQTEESSLYKKFEGVITNNQIENFDALVGYFRASGYFQMRHLLKEIPKIRILVGINVDGLSKKAHERGQLYFEDKDLTKSTFLDEVKKDIANANYRQNVEDGIIQFIEDIVSGRIEMRASGDRKLHAKIYIFRPKNFNEHTFGNVITGSSNFTSAGLGGKNNNLSNYEFNVLLRDYDNVQFALDEFEALWANATEILPVDAQKVKKESYINDEVTPFELYIKMLMEYFGKSVDRSEIFDSNLPQGYTNLEYQADAVIDGYGKMMRHNGFILADVVGLGKTVVAIRIIKKYIQHNGFNTKVLIIYPPALATNWKATIKDFQLTNYVQFITNGSLHKIIDGDNYDYLNPEDFDLIVVDESHKFRNTSSEQYALLELVCKTPRKKLGNDESRRKKVMLLSATPLNNRPDDIANQIYLFQDARKSTIDGVPNLQSFFYPKMQAYKKLKNVKEHSELVEKVKDIYLPIRDLVFKELVIRRTRADIRRIERYKKDIDEQGMTFPKENEPISVHYVFNADLENLFTATIDVLKDKLGYYRYRAIEFVNEEYQELYDNAKLISELLAGIMQTQLVKRLESSFFAFKNSLFRFQKNNQRMIEMFENDKIYIAPDLDINKYYAEGKEDEIEAKIEAISEEKPNNAIYTANDFDPALLIGLKADQKILNELVNKWYKINYDPKLDKFLEELEQTFLSDKNPEKKLVIFSESKDTVDYLKLKLTEIGRHDVLDVSSKNQKSRYNTIQRNFDANYKGNDREDKYKIIVTTEVLAEGINLHRSNVILNYDIPWNATRLMQRIGRINRLGSQAEEIFVYNFYPTGQSEDKIKLSQTALKKLQGFHAALGEDNKVYHQQEELMDNILGELDTKEEVNEMMMQLEFLRNFKDKNPKDFQRIKKMPLKSRTGRLASIKAKTAQQFFGQPIENACLCYIRNGRKDAFYLVNSMTCKEITFSAAVQLYQAEPTENRCEMLPLHFDWVYQAMDKFHQSTSINEFNSEMDLTNLAPQEKNAINLLDGLQDIRKKDKKLYSDNFEIQILTAKMIIYKGIFRKFRLQVAKLAAHQKKNRRKANLVVEELKIIFAKYPIAQIARLDKLRQEAEKTAPIIDNPTIVLSETFK